jgi:hypothetical protein
MYKRLAISQRKPEYPTQFWEGAKANEQIVKCAEADCLRASFPNLMSGLRVEGESIPAEPTVTFSEPAVRELAASVGALPEQDRAASPSSSSEPKKTPQSELEAFCLTEGFSFDQFRNFAATEQGLENADSFGSFAELPAELCKRMLRAKTGLKNALTADIQDKEGK